MNDRTMSESLKCRYCGDELKQTFVDLGMSPLCESYVSSDQLNQAESFYPLHAYVCSSCFLVQLGQFVSPQAIFGEYAYFSSFADTWLEHCKSYADQAIQRFDLGPQSRVIEVASNDGYLLQFFVDRGIPCFGIEPAANIARAAVQKGVPTLVEFLGRETGRWIAAEKGEGDLVVANNVIAHVPDLNDFVEGLKHLVKPDGVITVEFPQLQNLVDQNQFDTIYHEHFSYFSFTTIDRVFAGHGLVVFDVQKLPTHGGSLRVFARRRESAGATVTRAVVDLKKEEDEWGVSDLATYARYTERVQATKRSILNFLSSAKNQKKRVAGYGAPGKGNTLLNYCGIRTDFIEYTVDRNPYKHGKYTPGTHIPIYPPDRIRETKPDYLFILPWNLRNEIMEQNAFIRGWGGKFVVPIPEVAVL